MEKETSHNECNHIRGLYHRNEFSLMDRIFYGLKRGRRKSSPPCPGWAGNSSQGSAEWASEAREQGARPPSAPENDQVNHVDMFHYSLNTIFYNAPFTCPSLLPTPAFQCLR